MNVTCPHCNSSLEAGSSVVGTTVRCPVCNNNFVVGGAVKPKVVGQNNINNNNVPNYLVFAILTTIFCCLPLGVVSVIFSSQVDTKLAQGDILGARDASTKAKIFAIISAVLGSISIFIYFLLEVFIVMIEEM